MKDLEFIWAGRVAVDSGTLSVADPCYWKSEKLDFDYVVDALDKATEDDLPPVEVGDLPHVGASMALVFPTVTGDGIYDVYTVWRGDDVVGFFTSFIKEDFMEQENE
jgi:hypothetical protein